MQAEKIAAEQFNANSAKYSNYNQRIGKLQSLIYQGGSERKQSTTESNSA